jgi:hypothetical protein
MKMSVKNLVEFYRGRADHENDIEQLKNGVRALHADVRTTEIYTHVMSKDMDAVKSPLDTLK